MLKRVFAAALIAGFVAGFVEFSMHALRIDPLIAAAEVYEDAAAHAHGMAAEEEWEPKGAARTAFTFLANLVIGAGFGMVLCGVWAVRQSVSGAAPGLGEGLAWGAAGFAAFALAPAMGLPPVPPGMISADIYARQAWWLATALGTAGGLALLVFPRHVLWRAVGGLAIVLPHLVGAPAAPPGTDVVPPALVAQFVAQSLAAAALFWLTLGGVGGFVYRAMGRSA
jgi:cobalt transporter subunit CbtA